MQLEHVGIARHQALGAAEFVSMAGCWVRVACHLRLKGFMILSGLYWSTAPDIDTTTGAECHEELAQLVLLCLAVKSFG